MGCSVNGFGKQGELILNGSPCGLVLNHAYGISDVIEFEDSLDQKNKSVKLLRLRNPWGKSEWNGAWSSNSEEGKKYKQSLINYINTLPPEEQFDLDADDGTFLMHYDDWKNVFSQLFLNIDFPEKWTGVRFKSEWN